MANLNVNIGQPMTLHILRCWKCLSHTGSHTRWCIMGRIYLLNLSRDLDSTNFSTAFPLLT